MWRIACFRPCAISSAATSSDPKKDNAMTETRADRLVIFGATGDLAYQQIFPALYSMERHGTLDVPIVCVARPGLTLEDLHNRMRQSIADHGDAEPSVFDRLAA